MLLALTKYRGVDPIALSIYHKMTCYWDMHETGVTTRVDQINAINLSPSGTITNVSGPRGVGDIAQGFAGASNLASASLGSSSVISVPSGGGSHCFMGWFYVTSNTVTQALGGRWDGLSSTNLEYWLNVSSSHVGFYNGSSTYYSALVVAPAVANWHFAVGWRDIADGKVRLCIDDGSVIASSLSSNPIPRTSATEFGIAGSGVDPLTGRLSRFGWIKNDFLLPIEITWMYNMGQGRDWLEIKHLAGF